MKYNFLQVCLMLIAFATKASASEPQLKFECSLETKYLSLETQTVVTCDTKSSPVKFNAEDAFIELGCGFIMNVVDFLPEYRIENATQLAFDISPPPGAVIGRGIYNISQKEYYDMANWMGEKHFEYYTNVTCKRF